jgi:methionyl aminopeptidase
MLNLRSAREIERMRPACQLVAQAHELVRQAVRPGVTTAQLDQLVDGLFAQAGAIPLFKGYPGPVPFPAVTCISVNEQIVHGIPGDRVLRAGDIVSIDTGCKLNGWCGDAAVTHAVGSIAADTQRLLDVTQGVLDLAIERLAQRSLWSEVAAEMQEYIESAGFSVVKRFVGHGIGREMHEAPQVPNFVSAELKQRHDFRLRTGLVLAIEPMVNQGTDEVECLSDHWTQVTRDGKYSAHFEHTVALTPDGPVRLTQLDGPR